MTDRGWWRAGVALGLGVVVGVGVIAWQHGRCRDPWSGCRWWGHDFQLPQRMEIEEVVTNLSAAFNRGVVVEESPETPVHVARVEPGFKLHVDGRGRQAIVVSPPSQLLFRVRVPPGAALRFGVGVQGDGRRDRETQGIRFSVDVDEQETFAQTINPSATRGDRRWFDDQVDLRAEDGEREVEIRLRTRAVGADPRLGGIPGWSHLRIVRKIVRDRQRPSRTAPNVLILLVDTLRADHLGCYGASPSPSPILDGLARDGLLFEQVVSQSAWTMPSVASIFTGLHPRSHGLVGLSKQSGDADRKESRYESDPTYLSDSLATLAARAQRAGITTVGVSANPLVTRGTNLARGFETFVESGFQGRPARWRRADEVNRVFLGWLRKNGEHRFLAYLHYMDVHSPYQPPEVYRPAPPDGLRPTVARGDVVAVARRLDAGKSPPLTASELEYLHALYAAEITYWDAELAGLLEGLSDAGVADNTVLVTTADHGEGFLEHGRLKHGAHLYEEMIRVPLLVSGPTVGSGRVKEQVQGIDLFPTVAAVLGMDIPRDLPGRNAMGTQGDRPAISETKWGISPEGEETELVSLRTPAWKLIYRAASESFELYDLTRDPGEQMNRHGSVPEGPVMENMLADWQANAPVPPASDGRDPEFREKLRALGYVE